uniref:Uncharacterized protein n=1 Tax=Leersia perrieri TaxID=77586 RepID=A0A0D9XU06_9ORYZ
MELAVGSSKDALRLQPCSEAFSTLKQVMPQVPEHKRYKIDASGSHLDSIEELSDNKQLKEKLKTHLDKKEVQFCLLGSLSMGSSVIYNCSNVNCITVPYEFNS